MRVQIRLLGGFDVAVDGVPLPPGAWQRRSAGALVQLLALQPGRRLRREQVLDALWPGLLADQAAPRLHSAAHYARSALDTRDGVVLRGDRVLLLPAAEVTVDAAEFLRAADAARADGRPESAAAALDGFRGDLLPDDRYEPWAEEARTALRARRSELLRLAGRWSQLVDDDPLDEEAHLNLVRDHLGAGRPAAALRQLTAMEQVLRRELDVAPGEAAATLREEALALARPVAAPVDDAADEDRPPDPSLPVPPTPTIGRERDIDGVLRLLDRARLVTLTGPGGVGKTRLAIEVAHRLTGRDGIDARVVDLVRAGHGPAVVDVLAAEIGVQDCCDGDPERGVLRALRGRDVLLVLDNFEHVLDAAGLVGRLLARLPRLRVLVTSRARLRLAAEHVFDVAPLPVAPGSAGADGSPPAVALFAQAALAADPDFRLDRSLADVVAICRSVDGLPLAIELAAGHVRTLPPTQLRARLRARLGSPSGALRDAPPRHRTIPATIDWSLHLLGPAEQRLFPRLGVFAGSVPLEAVEQVCGDDGTDVVDVLARLVDQSLVRRVPGRGGAVRFRLLTLLRERARALLPPEEAALVRRRHTAWICAVVEEAAERAWTADGTWLDRIGELLPEIRAAHARAEHAADWPTAARLTAALGTFWHREGHHPEGRQWADTALAHAADLDDSLLARLHLAAGLVTWTADLPAARLHWHAAAALARRRPHPRDLACALAWTAMTFVGDEAGYPDALRVSDEAIGLARTVGELPLVAQALHVKGELARLRGDDALARAAFEEGRDLAARAGDGPQLATFLAHLGHLAVGSGAFGQGRRLEQRALTLAWSAGRRMLAASLISDLAGPELGLGRPERAAVLVGAADAALRSLGAVRAPSSRPAHEAVLRGLRTALGEPAFSRLHRHGGTVPLADAVRLGLAGWPTTAGPGRTASGEDDGEVA